MLHTTALLRSKFQNRGGLEGTIVGAPCRCLLCESERHVALPKGMIWPISQISHVKDGESRTNGRTDAICLRLASEHWHDEHWRRD